MSKWVPPVMAGLICFLAGWSVVDGLPAALGQEPKAPEWKYGLEFRVRKAGNPDFDKNTPRFGCEVYLDKAQNQSIYLCETGVLGVLPAGGDFAAGTEVKAPKWLHGLELKVRKAGEAEFTKDSKRYGIEVFRDENSGNLVYISETGALASIKSANAGGGEAKAPTWLHGLELKVRRGGEADFTDKTAKFGIEVFRDENNGNMVYVCENGNISVVAPPATPIVKEAKAPRWLHGLEFRVRPAGQNDFTKDTPNFGAEIFKDENTGDLVYISEKGFICVAPAGAAVGGTTKPPKWLQGVELKVRKAGEADFNKDTKKVGGEIFKDENTSNLVYISETASIGIGASK